MPTSTELTEAAERERRAEREARERADSLTEAAPDESLHEENSRGAERTLAEDEARIHAAHAESLEESAQAQAAVEESLEESTLDVDDVGDDDDVSYEYDGGDDGDDGDDDDFAELDGAGDDSDSADGGDEAEAIVHDVAGIPDSADGGDDDGGDDGGEDSAYAESYDGGDDDGDESESYDGDDSAPAAPRNIRILRAGDRNARAVRDATPEEIAALELELAQAQAMELAPLPALPVLGNAYAADYPVRSRPRRRNARAGR